MNYLGMPSYPYFNFNFSKEFEDQLKREREQNKIKKQRYKPVTWYSVIYKGRGKM